MLSEVWFLYTVRWPSGKNNLEEILFYEDLRAIAQSERTKVNLTLFVTNGSDEVQGGGDGIQKVYGRRITQQDLLLAVGPEERRQSVVCYICGLPAMTDTFVAFLTGLEGLSEQRVLCEKWW